MYHFVVKSIFGVCTIGALSSPLLVASHASANQLNWIERSSVLSSRSLWSNPSSVDSVGRPLNWQIVSPTDQVVVDRSAQQRSGSIAVSDPATAGAAPATRAVPVVMALSRSITVDRNFYPDVSLTVPNGFKRDPQRFVSLSLEGTNQIRRQAFQGCRGDSSCPDVEFNAELALLQSGPASLELQYTLADPFPDSNNANTLKGQALGFRLAVNVAPTVGIAIGGESILDLDGNNCPVDGTGCANLKGRTFYAVTSFAIPMSKAAKPPLLTLSAGAGSGYYGLSSHGASDSQWGPFGSISYAFNEYVSLGVEYSGYAISGGVSVKPFKDVSLTGSLYVTDFLGNFPSYIQNYCSNGDCSARALGRLTYSF